MSAITTLPKLARVLGMMGSSSDNEVLIAARTAEAIRRQMGMTWPELLAGQRQPERRPPPHDDWRVIVDQCLARPEALGPWEQRFLRSLRAFPRLSPKQAACLARIAEHVLGEETK